MSYSHLLVSVAVSPESHQLVARAVSIARPNNARISLITPQLNPKCITNWQRLCWKIFVRFFRKKRSNFCASWLSGQTILSIRR